MTWASDTFSTPITIPAVFNDYTKIKILTPSRFEWKQVDCRTDVVHADNTGEYGAPPPPRYTPPVRTYSPPKTYAQPASYGSH